MGKSKDGILWIGNHYEVDTHEIPELKNKMSLLFYKKCAIGEKTITQNSIVCIQNDDSIDNDSYETCDVGKILYLYEDNSNPKPIKRAVVQWYSRKSGLTKVVDEENLDKLDSTFEVVEDSRYAGDIAVDTIFDIGELFMTKEECRKAKKPKGRFFCSKRLVKAETPSKKFKYSLALCIGVSLKRVPETSLDVGKSPHGKWKVNLCRITEDVSSIALNPIENIQRTPKRKCVIAYQASMTPTENTNEDSTEEELTTPKKKLRRSNLKITENYTPTTPKMTGVTVRRKSILKTPTVSKANTPRRSIQFSQTIKEHKYEKMSVPDIAVLPNEEAIDEDMQSVRKRLHVSALPKGAKSLPCREKEFKEIYTFLEGNLTDEIGGCMYVSGVPGTGKTETTTAVIRALKSEVENENLPEFDYIEINGMKLTEPRQAYVEICRQLLGKKLPWEQAFAFLDKRFSTPSHRRCCTILIVDELDILCNKRQDVIYNLLNWPHQDSARLTVVTIANTMDLPERVFLSKIASRLGLTRLTFHPYTHKQLQDIVAARLSGLDSFSSDAIQLVARKVAALSGDARRALDICRRASEIAESDAGDPKATVTIAHVQEALNEMISCTKVRIIKSLSQMEKFFMQAVCMEIERTGIEEVVFQGVYHQLKILASLHGSQPPTFDRAMAISVRLGACRLLICEHSRKDIWQKIFLNVSADDVYYAIELRNQE